MTDRRLTPAKRDALIERLLKLWKENGLEVGSVEWYRDRISITAPPSRKSRTPLSDQIDQWTAKSGEPCVYFIKADRTNRIKIGFTNSLRNRAKALSNASPDHLDILLTMPGNMALEAALHRRFKNDRVRGEWFRASGDVLGFIQLFKLNEADAIKQFGLGEFV